MSNRRDFFKKIGALGITAIATKLSGNNKLDVLENIASKAQPESDMFTLPNLPYDYNALEPFIDEQTMRIHHTKHHKSYVDKLNAMPPSTFNLNIDDASKCQQIDASSASNSSLKNNLGGHVNHSLFWKSLKPNATSEPNFPKEKLSEALLKEFKSFDEFKKQFSESALKHFGSGWCWLIIENNKLKITTTVNQDNPFMKINTNDHSTKQVILALDVWEHAYYLKYQNKRADYISNWWNIINWDQAEILFIKNKL